MSKVVLFLADGFEEIEALSVVDILRRGNVDIKTMSIKNSVEVVGKSGITVMSDICFNKKAALDADMIVLPGGGLGTENLKNNHEVENIIKIFFENNKYIAAICAAPSILGIIGILNGKKAICYPGFESQLEGAEIVNENVVKDGNIITSKGPGTAADFAFCILDALKGEKCAEEVKKGFIYK